MKIVIYAEIDESIVEKENPCIPCGISEIMAEIGEEFDAVNVTDWRFDEERRTK